MPLLTRPSLTTASRTLSLPMDAGLRASGEPSEWRQGGGKGTGGGGRVRRHPQPPPPPQQRRTPRPLPPKSRQAPTQPESEVNNEHHNGTRTWGQRNPETPAKLMRSFPKGKTGGGKRPRESPGLSARSPGRLEGGRGCCCCDEAGCCWVAQGEVCVCARRCVRV